MNVKPPSKQTLRKYGLTEKDWVDMLESQGGVCPICNQLKPSMVIDHEHYRNWKKLPSDVRKSYVRGIICSWCNRRIVGKGATPGLLMNGAMYLSEYSKRRHGEYSGKEKIK